MVTEKHEPAYPNPGEMWNGNKVSGLTKREYFAALAMQGYIIASHGNEKLLAGYVKNAGKQNKPMCNMLAEAALNYADALIDELNK